MDDVRDIRSRVLNIKLVSRINTASERAERAAMVKANNCAPIHRNFDVETFTVNCLSCSSLEDVKFLIK